MAEGVRDEWMTRGRFEGPSGLDVWDDREGRKRLASEDSALQDYPEHQDAERKGRAGHHLGVRLCPLLRLQLRPRETLGHGGEDVGGCGHEHECETWVCAYCSSDARLAICMRRIGSFSAANLSAF